MTIAAITGTYVLHEHTFPCQAHGNYPLTGVRILGRERLQSRELFREQPTPREMQIAPSVAEGQSNREVAAALYVMPKTVEFHLTRIYRKLGLRSRSELARDFR